jgi:excisionase family DNA binding protein
MKLKTKVQKRRNYETHRNINKPFEIIGNFNKQLNHTMSSNIRIKRICQHCENEFIAKTTVTKYCGDNCAKRAYKARKKAEKMEASNEETKKQIEKLIIEIQAKEFLTIKETCQLLGLSRTTVWRAIKNGRIKSAKFGTRVIIRKEDLHTLFN